MTCIIDGKHKCPEHGKMKGNECTYRRLLCVHCNQDGGNVKIRTQSNGMPSHCFASEIPLKRVEIDYEAVWLPKTGVYDGAKLNQTGLEA